MSWFGTRKPKQHESQAKAAATPPRSATKPRQATPQSRPEPLDTSHPVFRLKAGMGTEEVVELLGRRYLAMNDNQLLDVMSNLPGVVYVQDDTAGPQECWLYSNAPKGHCIEIVFLSSVLATAEVKEMNADDGTRRLVARIDQDGLTAAESY